VPYKASNGRPIISIEHTIHPYGRGVTSSTFFVATNSTLAVAKYILENPVRAGIVTEPRAYPFWGSFALDDSQLDELWQIDAAAFDDV